MQDVKIIKGFLPGSIGRAAEWHGRYCRRHRAFGLFFEATVATEPAAFLGRYDDQRDGFWTAVSAGSMEGSIAFDGTHAASEGAHLRWFILSDVSRGKGIGRRLLERAVGFRRFVVPGGYPCGR